MSPAQVESMMYYGKTPWHRLGTEVEGLATAEEAIAAAGLNWDVDLTPVYVDAPIPGMGGMKPIPDKMAIYRKTDGQVYNVVGNRYAPIQNSAAFSFFDGVVGAGGAVYETAGSLLEGRQVWILANLKDSLGIAGEEIKKYLLLTNSHDGSMALQMFWTPIRVVCWNTLSAALASGEGARFYSRHTAGATDRIESAKQVLGLARIYYDEFKAKAEMLAQKQLPPAEMPKLLMAAFGTTGAKRMEDISPVTAHQMERAKEAIFTGPGADNAKIQGTAWQAFNGITYYTDHLRNYRGGTDDSRLGGLLFGTGMAMKQRAWQFLAKV